MLGFFNHNYAKRILTEAGNAIGSSHDFGLHQSTTEWKVVQFVNGERKSTAYINENPDCCVAFLEGAKWIMDNAEEVKSAQIRMADVLEEHDETLTGLLEACEAMLDWALSNRGTGREFVTCRADGDVKHPALEKARAAIAGRGS